MRPRISRELIGQMADSHPPREHAPGTVHLTKADAAEG